MLCTFQVFKESKIEHFDNYGTTSGTYWVNYKPSVLSYTKAETCEINQKKIFQGYRKSTKYSVLFQTQANYRPNL